MHIKFWIITFMFAFATVFAQASDGLKLNIRLYPVQTLAISNNESEGNIPPEYVAVSSPSGFQVKVSHKNYNDEDSDNSKILLSQKSQDCNKEYNLIDASKGVAYKMYKINQNIEKAIKKSRCVTSQNNLLVFTLISQ